MGKKLSSKQKKLLIVFLEHFHHAQKIQNQTYNNGIKSRSYALSNKIWLINKYIKIKQN